MKICRHNKIKAKKRVLDLKLGRKDIDRNVGPQFSEYSFVVQIVVLVIFICIKKMM